MTMDSRMPEIKANLKQDAQELLQESARLLTGFFSRGLCSVRMAAERWKAFASGISDAAKNLVKPDFVYWTETREQAAQGEPLVAVLESTDEQIKNGRRMCLSKADALVERLDAQNQKAGVEPTRVRLMIDYTLEGQRDKYYAEVTLGDGGGSLLEQIRAQIEAYRLNPGKTEKLLEGAAGETRTVHLQAIQADMDKTATRVLGYFQRHCDIARMESRMAACAETLPVQAKEQFLAAAREEIHGLRQEANQKPMRAIPVRRPQGRAKGPAERPSIKLTLERNKAAQAPRDAPERMGRAAAREETRGKKGNAALHRYGSERGG